MEKEFKIGAIIKPHGVHGEFKVYSTTDDNERFKKLKNVIVRTAKDEFTAKVVSVKASETDVILKIEGYDTPEAIEKLRKAELFVTRDNAVKLKKNEYFVADLIGLKVTDIDMGDELGILTDVLQTGANDVYEVTISEEKKVLIPAIKECIRSVDIEAGNMEVHLLPGLLDL
ncbi:MAG: 16S rRNA processing protein RimM [Lachnospiraceae bacterium]|nr:16S rRNA processing protein RimM [Lachnospiraceae bacterium]MBQ9580476.1 16S rRNA processing protein RimM [Lachnospiraceae bacterium]MBR0434465.1 16S rRNA processing protein RimM [Lachnospiraceae bacterium]